jgi:AraC-like DNA-binding protein
MTGTPAVNVVRHESPMGRWEMALRDPHPRLRVHVRRYCGWIEHMATALTRRELPTEEIPVIINFGSPVRVYDAGESDRFVDLDSFATGAYDAFVRVRSQGPSGGVQVNFTILGARLFLGRPLGELHNRSVALDDLLGPFARQLAGRLREAPTWDARFDLLDRVIGARLEAAARPSSSVICTWHRLLESHGLVSIGDVVSETGWSQKHLIARFKHEIGLAPKTMARVLRFSRAADALRGGDARLADIAADCGYYDQAHFTRDFREFAGVTPGELMANVLPDGAGIAASEP